MSGGAPEDDEVNKKNPHKHNSGAADLERVTDFVEEKELSSVSDATLSNLAVNSVQKPEKEAKIVMTKEDLEILMVELEMTKQQAERKLREHRGNLKEAIIQSLQLPVS